MNNELKDALFHILETTPTIEQGETKGHKFIKGDLVMYYGRLMRVNSWTHNGYKLQSMDGEEIMFRCDEDKMKLVKRK